MNEYTSQERIWQTPVMWKRYIYYDSAAIGLLGLGSAFKKSTKIVNAETFILVKKWEKNIFFQ